MVKQFLAALLGLLILTGAALGQPYPSRPVRVIIPFGAGGGGDVSTRIILDRVQKETGAQFVVENRSGALGIVGAMSAIRAVADGYTLIMTGTSTHSLAPYLSKEANYDPLRDFTHISAMTFVPFAIMVPAASKFHSIQDLIEAAKAKPGALTYGFNSGGNQIVSAKFHQHAGIEALPVPYKAAPEVTADLLSGRLDYMVMDGATASGLIKGGRARALVVLTSQQSSVLPGVASMADAGLDPIDLMGWTGMGGPAGIPSEARDWLSRHLKVALAHPEVKEKLKMLAVDVVGNVELENFIRAQLASWGEAAEKAGITPQ